jgi:hypothetical protein
MNGIGPELSYDAIVALTARLYDACGACRLQVQRTDEAQIRVFRINLADLLLRRFLLCLHRPLVSRVRSNTTYCYFRKVCLDSSMALISPTMNADFSHILLLGGGMFKNRIIHASLALSSELLIEMSEQGPQFQALAPLAYQKMLIDALKIAYLQLEERIKLGETNVKLHMKLSVVLCRAQCAESGQVLQQRMVQL